MKPTLRKHQNKLRFVFVGGINTALDFGILFLLTGVGIDKYLANYTSTLTAFVFSFFANRKYTFKSASQLKTQMIPFTIVTLSSAWILQPLVIWLTLQRLEFIDEPIALLISKIIAILASLSWNYYMYSRYVFKD